MQDMCQDLGMQGWCDYNCLGVGYLYFEIDRLAVYTGNKIFTVIKSYYTRSIYDNFPTYWAITNPSAGT